MSDTRFVPVDEVEREEVREPAKRWRNRYMLICEAAFCDGCGAQRHLGEVWESCCRDFPSKDAAETAAAEALAWEVRTYGAACDFYLGAFPIEDT